MTFVNPAINFSESLGINFSRLISYYVREALKQLAANPCRESGIHEARLLFKRSRSLIRMAGIGLQKNDFRRLDRFFRDQGRVLGEIRDVKVITQVLRPAMKEIPEGDEHTLLTRFHASLMDLRKSQQWDQQEAVAKREVIHRLTRMQEEVASWKPLEDSPAVFLTGVRILFGACRKRCKALEKASNDQTFHQWRKEIKFLSYQVELLEGLWPVRLNAWIMDLKTLSQGLGRHHDLVLLETALKSFAGPGFEPLFSLTLEKITAEKGRIERETISLGKKFFSMKGSCFYRQLEACREVALKKP